MRTADGVEAWFPWKPADEFLIDWSIRKLQSQSDAVRAELARVFGEEVQFAVEADPLAPTPDRAVVIALGVLLGLSMLALMVTVVLVVR